MKQYSSKTIASFFDTHVALDTSLPRDLMEAWLTGKQDERRAQELLSPYKIRGTVVISDASGLSKLSREMEMETVLALIHKPKKILYHLGKSIGGHPCTTWVADNTHMLYGEEVPLDDIADMISKMQSYLSHCEVKTSIGVYSGELYSIEGKLFGPQLKAIDEIAEDLVGSGEIWVAGDILPHVEKGQLVHHDDVIGDMYVLEGHREYEEMYVEDSTTYPHSFDDTFYDLLDLFAYTKDESIIEVMRRDYQQHKIVLFAKGSFTLPADTFSGVLNAALWQGIFAKEVKEIFSKYDVELVKIQGDLVVALADDIIMGHQALHALRSALEERGIEVSMGIDGGDIFIFPLGPGTIDIAGEAVNIASKLAEDVGEQGAIFITDRMMNNLDDPLCHRDFDVSGVTLQVGQY